MNESDENEKAFTAVIRADLDRGADALDEGTRRALANARRHAMNHRPRPRTYWRAAGGLALAGLAALAVVKLYQPPPTSVQPSSGLEDVELLSSAEELDLYKDMDFYFWLAADEHADS